MKKILIAAILCLSLTSCMTMAYGSWASHAKSVVKITDYSAQMDRLKAYFPEIYELYKVGKVSGLEVYDYEDRNGLPKTHIEYYLR